MINRDGLIPSPVRGVQRTASQNGQTKKPAIRVAEPYPLLDPGEYVALCIEADYAWTKQYKAWKARLMLEPQDYAGRPYTGRLCKFLGLGQNPEAPYAGPRSDFRKLLVDVNGAQPSGAEIDMNMFVGRLYRITVETVTTNKKGELLGAAHWYSTVRSIYPVAPSIPSNQWNSGNLGNPLTAQPSNRGNQPLGKHSVAKELEERKTFG